MQANKRINENHNFVPSLFQPLCEISSDCFKCLSNLSSKNTSTQNNQLQLHTMTSKKIMYSYCLQCEKIQYSMNYCSPTSQLYRSRNSPLSWLPWDLVLSMATASSASVTLSLTSCSALWNAKRLSVTETRNDDRDCKSGWDIISNIIIDKLFFFSAL